MAGRSDIAAGRAFVEIYVKNSLLMKGLGEVSKAVGGLGADVMALGLRLGDMSTRIGQSLVGAVQYFESTGSALNDMSARTGVAGSALAELQYAAEQSGAEMGDVEMAVRKTQKAITSAANGSKEAAADFQRLGLSVEELKNLSPDQQFEKVAQAIAAIEDPTQRTAAAMEIFGKSGTKLLPMLMDLADLRNKARDLGIVPTDDSIALADALGDAFGDVRKVVGALTYEIGGALAPAILPLADALARIGAGVLQWTRANSGILTSMGQMAGGIVGVMAGLGVTVARFSVYLFDVFNGVSNAIAGVFGQLGVDLKATWQGLADSIAAGDLEAAARVALASFDLMWHQITKPVNDVWRLSTLYFSEVWDTATNNLAQNFINIYAQIRSGWANVVSGMSMMWAAFTNEAMDRLSGLAAFQRRIADALLNVQVTLGMLDPAAAHIASMQMAISDTARSGSQFDLPQELAKIEAQRQKALQNIERERAGAIGVLGDDRQRKQEENINAYYRGLEDKAKALAKARKEFEAANNAAAEKAAGVVEDRQKFGVPGFDLGAIPELSKGPGVAGTFSASAIEGVLGRANPQREVANEIRNLRRESLQRMDRQIEAIRQLQLRFVA